MTEFPGEIVERCARAFRKEWGFWNLRRKMDGSGYEAVRADLEEPISDDTRELFHIGPDNFVERFNVMRDRSCIRAALSALPSEARGDGWQLVREEAIAEARRCLFDAADYCSLQCPISAPKWREAAVMLAAAPVRPDIPPKAGEYVERLNAVLEWADELFATVAALRDGGITNNQLEEAYCGYADAANKLPRGQAASAIASLEGRVRELEARDDLRDEDLDRAVLQYARNIAHNVAIRAAAKVFDDKIALIIAGKHSDAAKQDAVTILRAYANNILSLLRPEAEGKEESNT